jgi:hypothetical protein
MLNDTTYILPVSLKSCFNFLFNLFSEQEPRKGPVIVKVSDFRGESKQNFEFVDPQIKAIRPRRGPQSGGTRIKILGEHMDAGSFKEAFVGDYPCEIVETRPGRWFFKS